ncbi:MAG: hypothetical protein IJA36_13020 [Lachnospiraceae bacterium]|nr:hypothetical protein [Lachnospiraceae bacterium]
MAEEFESSELEDTKKKKKGRKRKENEIETAMNMDDELYERSGGGISTVIVTIAIIVIWLAVFAILIKWDVGNFGSTVLYPVLKDVPIINMILPEVEETQKEESGYGYATLAEAVAEIKRLEAELEESKTANSADDEVVQELSAEIDRLKKFEENQVQFEKTKTKFYEDVIFADNAPDIENYKEYYELIEPEAAAELYKQVVQQISYDEQVEEYAKAYGEMKPAQAAGVFEAMTDDLELAARILQNIDATQRGKILGAMDPEIAARITKIMEP